MVKVIHKSNGNITVDVGEYNQEEIVFIIRRALTNYNIELSHGRRKELI